MRRRTLAAGAALTLTMASAALVSELALPSVAEGKVRDRLAAIGTVSSVKVSTSPAVKLLFGNVDRAEIRMSSATVDADTMDAELLDRASGMDVLDARIDELRAGPVEARSVVLAKRGRSLDATASLDVAQLESLLPGVTLSTDAGQVVLEIAELPLPLPIPGPIRLQIAAEAGNVVVRPLGPVSALLPTQPILERPELSVGSLRGTITDGELKVTASATLNL